jgi:hypothetical protein
VRCSAGQGWHHDWDLMPCQRACIARPGEVGVHGNARPAPDALDALRTTVQQGCSDAHGRARVLLSWGIDQARVEELGGEVTGPGVVGVVQPKMGVHDGQGDGAGGVGCSSEATASWGRGLVPCEVEIDYRGSRAVPGRRVEGEGDALAGPRASFSPRVQTIDDQRKGLHKSLDSKRRSPAGLSSLLVRL